jgi:hypothetical protein
VHPCSADHRRVGVHDFTFEACSGFTRVTARGVANPPEVGIVPGTSTSGVTPERLPGGYRVEPTMTRADLSSAGPLHLRGALRNAG